MAGGCEEHFCKVGVSRDLVRYNSAAEQGLGSRAKRKGMVVMCSSGLEHCCTRAPSTHWCDTCFYDGPCLGIKGLPGSVELTLNVAPMVEEVVWQAAGRS